VLGIGDRIGSRMATRLTLRLDFEGNRRLGPGKIALLEAVQRTGSISAAGREFGMSYRRAWLLVSELNAMFAGPLVEARIGGRTGGGAELTPLGQKVAALYRGAETKAVRTAAEEIANLESALSQTAGKD